MRWLTIFRAVVARWRIYALDRAGTMERALVLVPGGEEGTLCWSVCGAAQCGGGAGSTPVGASTPVCGVVLSWMRVFLIGLSEGGGCSPVVGVVVETYFGCHSLSCGSSAAATMIYVRGVATSLWRMWC